MEIRQLTYFVAIAESGSFTEASHRCYVSQSAISQQIKLLEEELGTSLLIRSSHYLSLTESGEMLLPLAKTVLKDIGRCHERVHEVNNLMTGNLAIGLTYSLESYVRRAVADFIRLYPNVRLNIFYKTIPELMRMLREGELDMAFCIKVDNETDGVESSPVLEYRLCAIMRDTHPLSTRKELSFEELRLQRVLLPEAGIRDQNAVEKFLSESARELQRCTFVNDPCAILNILKISNCVSILPEHIIKGVDELHAVPVTELSCPIVSYVHRIKGREEKRACRAFRDLLKSSGV